MDNIETVCDACGGLRYSKEALQYKLSPQPLPVREGSEMPLQTESQKEKPSTPLKSYPPYGGGAGGEAREGQGSGSSLSIAEVMDLSVRLASDFFRGTIIEQKLRPLMDVGLGYLHLNQALSTLSGGELQRLKIASYLGERGKTFIIDEPTDGLHPKDVQRLVNLFEQMVDEGNTVYVVEHNTDVIKAADYVIELGPGAGEQGGRILFAGKPRDLLDCRKSVTAEYL